MQKENPFPVMLTLVLGIVVGFFMRGPIGSSQNVSTVDDQIIIPDASPIPLGAIVVPDASPIPLGVRYATEEPLENPRAGQPEPSISTQPNTSHEENPQ